ncbi:MAG: rRNA processing protein RimM [Bryobacterales bacterium]|nr:rRNA processing protein RimM [Bryobacterales bacterium]
MLAISQTDVPGRIEGLRRAQARLADGSDVEIEISEAWPYRGDWVLKLAGVDSIDEADRFRGADIWVPLAERGSLPDGEFFQSDLLGCTIVDEATGRELGVVDGWQQYGGPSLLQVQVDGREVLIPFVEQICRKVDSEARIIRVDLPKGLLEL